MAYVNLLPMLLGLPFLAAAPQTPSNPGRWIVSTDYFGTPLTPLLNLEQTGEKVTATGRVYRYVGTLEGTALYLMATDKKIIARHGSTLNFDTTTDYRHSGTCFKFFLPFQKREIESGNTTQVQIS